jgi:hypothetical protein
MLELAHEYDGDLLDFMTENCRKKGFRQLMRHL